jgi:hypothetical protein
MGGLLAAISQGCTITTSDKPLDDAGFPTGDDDGSTGTTPTANDCNECLFAQCGGQWSVCQNNADCRNIYQCATTPGGMGECSTSTCCFCGAPNGQKSYQALSTCDSFEMCNPASCADKCKANKPVCPAAAFPSAEELGCPNTTQTDSGAPPDDSGAAADTSTAPDTSTPPQQDAGVVAQDCNSCVASQCASQQQACASGSDCDKYSQCVAACQNAQCVTDCGTTTPAGQTASAALATCTSANCASQCGL